MYILYDFVYQFEFFNPDITRNTVCLCNITELADAGAVVILSDNTYQELLLPSVHEVF